MGTTFSSVDGSTVALIYAKEESLSTENIPFLISINQECLNDFLKVSRKRAKMFVFMVRQPICFHDKILANHK